MRVLVACEFSGRVRDAFIRRGHDAISCDLLPSEAPGPHYTGDALMLLRKTFQPPWDLLIAHPPCTYLANSGARWWRFRRAEQNAALEFVRRLMAAPVLRIAIENPPGRIGTAIRKADQYIHPWQFGHLECKTTGLWLKNLPLLVPTCNVREEMLRLPERERCRVHWAKPGRERWRERSRTFAGIAEAMAAQWGGEQAPKEPPHES